MKYQGKNWSTEIEAYKSGTISDDDRYLLEKAALDDEFLFDALEGYKFYQYAKADTEVVPGAAKGGARLFSMRNIAVAASLALLVGVVGYLQMDKGQTDGYVSVADDTEVLAMNEEESAVATSTLDNGEMQNETKVTDVTIIEAEVDRKSTSRVTSKVAKKEVVADVVQRKETVASPPEETEADEIAQHIASYEKQQPKVRAKPIETNDGPQLNLTTGSSTALKSKSSSTQTLAPARGLGDDDLSKVFYQKVTPPDGWQAYANYVKKEKKEVTTSVPTKVYVTFTVGVDGKLTGVRANMTDCPACDREAERVIKRGGSWTNHTSKPELIAYILNF